MARWDKMINDSFLDGRSLSQLMEEAYQLGREEELKEIASEYMLVHEDQYEQIRNDSTETTIYRYEQLIRRNMARYILTHTVNEILDKTYDQMKGRGE